MQAHATGGSKRIPVWLQVVMSRLSLQICLLWALGMSFGLALRRLG